MVYVDAGVMAYCDSPSVKDAAVELTLYDIASWQIRRRWLPGSVFPIEGSATMCISRFPLAWSLSDRKLRILFPNVHIDSIGRMVFFVWTDKDITPLSGNRQEERINGFQPSSAFTVTNNIAIYNEWHGRGVKLQPLTSLPFVCNSFRAQEGQQNIWYDLDDTNVVVRFPFAKADSSAWQPCAEPYFVRWSEFQFTTSYNETLKHESILRMTVKGSQNVTMDSFVPVGSVRIAGRRVMSDDPNADFPEKAEWLIWEKDGNDYRLCQIRDGRWTVYRETTRKVVPKTIVVNNDSNVVVLLYSEYVDPKDVRASLEKIVRVIRACGALTLAGED